MTIVLNGTTGISGVDGSASTPSLQGNDTNTGIFYPAADTIAFAEGGVEAMRIDSSGNVGIGTTSPSQLSTYRTLDVRGSVGGGFRFGNATDSGYLYSDSNETNIASATSKPLLLSTNTAERMRIDSSGGVSIGATATYLGTERFSVTATAAGWPMSLNCTTSAANGLYIRYSTSPNNTGSDFFAAVDSTATRVVFRSNGGLANYSGNNVNLSDQREKTNIELAGSYLDKICAIPVKTFNYIDQNMENDGGLTLGVIAQDVQKVAPELVTESNWGTEAEPKERLSIYQTDLQYALMKCIQEQQTIINDLKARVTALEAKIV